MTSYVFYASWNPPFLLLLWLSTLTDWIAGRQVHQQKNPRVRRLWLLLSLGVNLGMLVYFKYGNFFIENLNHLWETLGFTWKFGEKNIILPVGISFYTFQTLTYTIDIYRGKLAPSKSPVDYALYVTFFPQLVAGPIVRASEFLPQCQTPKKSTPSQLGWGLSLLVLGLFMKVVIADTLSAPVVDAIFRIDHAIPCSLAWTAALAFSMQIFCDFAGYSTCAIGVALCLGFELPDNFHFPYAARGFSDFWRRWHITLSSWLRDYLYIPLGGNRKGFNRTQINLMVTMLLGGLWHGASWMFVIWGALHGFFLLAERWILTTPLAKWIFWKGTFGKIILSMTTFAGVCIAWVFFRARTLDQAFEFTAAMFGGSDRKLNAEPLTPEIQGQKLILGISLLVLILHHLLRDSSVEAVFKKLPWILRSLLLALMMYVTLISMTGEASAFLYFQF